MKKKDLVELLNQFDDEDQIHFSCSVDQTVSNECEVDIRLDEDFEYDIAHVHEDFDEENEELNKREIGRVIVFSVFGDMTYQE